MTGAWRMPSLSLGLNDCFIELKAFWQGASPHQSLR